jgi:serine/threonine protein kinase
MRYRLISTLLSLQQLEPQPGLEAVLGVGESHNSIWVVTDFSDAPTLETWRDEKGSVPFEQAIPILRTVADILDSMAERGNLHGWFSADQVLLRPDSSTTVTGFGLGIIPGAQPTKYVAPETNNDGKPIRSADIFALGVLARKIINPEQITLSVRQVLERMTHDDPEQRYETATQAINELASAPDSEEVVKAAAVVAPPPVSRTPLATAPTAASQEAVSATIENEWEGADRTVEIRPEVPGVPITLPPPSSPSEAEEDAGDVTVRIAPPVVPVFDPTPKTAPVPSFAVPTESVTESVGETARQEEESAFNEEEDSDKTVRLKPGETVVLPPSIKPSVPSINPPSTQPTVSTNGLANGQGGVATVPPPTRKPTSEESSVMPGVKQSKSERNWVVIAIILFIVVCVGLWFLLSGAFTPKP